ncbi:hypothetical protein PG988_002325 [Apiospora saccharicola]
MLVWQNPHNTTHHPLLAYLSIIVIRPPLRPSIVRIRHRRQDLGRGHRGQGLLLRAHPLAVVDDGRQHGVAAFGVPLALQPLPPRHAALPEHGHDHGDHGEADEDDADDGPRDGDAALLEMGRRGIRLHQGLVVAGAYQSMA